MTKPTNEELLRLCDKYLAAFDNEALMMKYEEAADSVVIARALREHLQHPDETKGQQTPGRDDSEILFQKWVDDNVRGSWNQRIEIYCRHAFLRGIEIGISTAPEVKP